MKKIILAIAITTVLWFTMFSPWTSPHLNFWVAMSCAAIVLWILSLSWGKGLKRVFTINAQDILLGVSSAALLWGIFYVGEWLSSMIFDFARPQVDAIYGMKEGNNYLYLSLALLLIIGPAEEIFWRGYIQQFFEEKYNRWWGWAITSLIYALVHIWSFNFMLIMAALVCGLFWGLIYCFRKNLFTVILSHALWDVAVFLWFPILG